MNTCCEVCLELVDVRLITDDPDTGLTCEDCLNPQGDHWGSLRLVAGLVNAQGVEMTPDQIWERLLVSRNVAVANGGKLAECAIPMQLHRLTVSYPRLLWFCQNARVQYLRDAEQVWGEMPDAGPDVESWLDIE